MRRSQNLTTKLSNEGKLKITKIEAAVFQLETAIELWFNGGDAASIVTLAFAAHEIIYQINKAHPSGSGTLLAPDKKLFKDAKILDEWETIFKLDSYFCKHGGGTPNETHFLAHKNLKYVITDAIRMFNACGYMRRGYFQIFQSWIWTKYPEFFSTKQIDLGAQKWTIREVIRAGKKEFFNSMKISLSRDFSAPWTRLIQKNNP